MAAPDLVRPGLGAVGCSRRLPAVAVRARRGCGGPGWMADAVDLARDRAVPRAAIRSPAAGAAG